MDRIIVTGLPLRVHIGWTEAERAEAQDITVHIEMSLDLRPAGSTDDLAGTVDYDDVCERVTSLAQAQEFRLIEALADGCARMLLDDFSRVDQVRVEVRKPGALRSRGAPYAAAEVTRRRG